MGNVIWILPLLVWGKPFIYYFVFIFAKKKKIKKVNKLYFQIKSKFSRRQLAVWVPLSESYVNQSSRRSKTWRSAERRLMQTPIDWLTYWHKLAADWLKDWMTGRLAAWLMVVSSQLKWKSRTVSMSIQAIYQSCLEINQPKPSQATQSVQSVSHSMCLVPVLLPTPVRIRIQIQIQILILIQNHPILVPSVCAMHFWHFIDWRGNIDANTHTVPGENANI